MGLPESLTVTAANVTDRDGALQLVESNPVQLSKVLKYFADGGYRGENFANAIKAVNGAEVEIVKRNELHTFKVLPKRWIVERSFGWVDKCRRLWKNCERQIPTTIAMVELVFIGLILRRY